MITLRQPLTLAECQLVREWRNDPSVAPILRTGVKTEAEQEEFYRSVICNPDSPHKYYAVVHQTRSELTTYLSTEKLYVTNDEEFIGIGGLTYIEHQQTEISLVLGPDFRGHGYGTEVVDLLLTEAKRLGLDRVVGECYATGNLKFWTQQIVRRPATLKWTWDLHA